jgi:dephospho-CoA kinase
MIIGLTGRYCAGKNAAAEILSQYGIPSIDVDKLGHLALSAEIDRIEQIFGSEVIIEPDGADISRRVDRKALGNLVFSNPEALEKLEAVLHPWMRMETERLSQELLSSGSTHVLVNAAILYKMKLDSLCNCIIWIEAPLLKRIIRALKRDSAGILQVLKRIYAQRQLNPKPSAKSVDIYRIGNNSGTKSLKRKLEIVLKQIEQKGRDGR